MLAFSKAGTTVLLVHQELLNLLPVIRRVHLVELIPHQMEFLALALSLILATHCQVAPFALMIKNVQLPQQAQLLLLTAHWLQSVWRDIMGILRASAQNALLTRIVPEMPLSLPRHLAAFLAQIMLARTERKERQVSPNVSAMLGTIATVLQVPALGVPLTHLNLALAMKSALLALLEQPPIMRQHLLRALFALLATKVTHPIAKLVVRDLRNQIQVMVNAQRYRNHQRIRLEIQEQIHWRP